MKNSRKIKKRFLASLGCAALGAQPRSGGSGRGRPGGAGCRRPFPPVFAFNHRRGGGLFGHRRRSAGFHYREKTEAIRWKEPCP